MKKHSLSTPQAKSPLLAEERPGVVLLAAGQSRRMGKPNKLLLPFQGETVLRRTVKTILEAGLRDVVVVTGHEAEQVGATVADLPVQVVHHPGYAEGMGTSIRAGVEALPETVVGYAIALGDMPLLTVQTWRRLVEALVDASSIMVPMHENKRGHPVVFGARYRSELLALGGDTGARSILKRHPEVVRLVSVPDAGILIDIDTPDGYADLTEY